MVYNYGRKLTITYLQGDNRIVDRYQLPVAEIVASQNLPLAIGLYFDMEQKSPLSVFSHT